MPMITISRARSGKLQSLSDQLFYIYPYVQQDLITSLYFSRTNYHLFSLSIGPTNVVDLRNRRRLTLTASAFEECGFLQTRDSSTLFELSDVQPMAESELLWHCCRRCNCRQSNSRACLDQNHTLWAGLSTSVQPLSIATKSGNDSKHISRHFSK
ncbi:hypothetical protein HYPSUDRAFT_623541 [Hypholoma sublateritium FD-334 SS-4]|uniref:Uncharacterized protein n=1 Tax=Hypholoma sublateritium (strain FD-334 SS-4) TaxID=945553 RepID=A0A0D2QB15_HYPSF|nr:hypothetical protein HYPSUDRAFT_623541 [Hypholoma sublateritium FD-334 SS-4]